MNVRAHDLLLCWPLVYFHKSQELCHSTVHMCTWHNMHCVRTVRSDIKCICHVSRGPLLVQKRSCARTISLARLRSGKWWLGGPPATIYHNTRALQAQPTHARSSHLAWKDSWDILNSHTHVSFPTVSFCPATLVPRCSERYSGLHQPHNCNFASPSRG